MPARPIARSGTAGESAIHGGNLKLSSFPARIIVSCPKCQLRLFLPQSGRCTRCNCKLGVSFLEIAIPELRSVCEVNDYENLSRLAGQALRMLRHQRGLTQIRLARAAKMDRSQLSRLESGYGLPSPRTLLRIVAALGADNMVLRFRTPSRRS
jgi:DNA-binding phage protein